MRQKIRAELLAQHRELRRRIDEARVIVQYWSHERVSRREVRAMLIALGSALEAHNEHEERLLRDLSAAGSAGENLMSEHHVEEHHELYGALIVASESPNGSTGAPLLQFLFNRIVEHMEREERTVLRDTDFYDVDDAATGF
jgi:hypothetical protein